MAHYTQSALTALEQHLTCFCTNLQGINRHGIPFGKLHYKAARIAGALSQSVLKLELAAALVPVHPATIIQLSLQVVNIILAGSPRAHAADIQRF